MATILLIGSIFGATAAQAQATTTASRDVVAAGLDAHTRIAPSCDSGIVDRRHPVSGRELPRFETIKAEEANFRRGPGLSYAVDWVIKRRRMPVCVISEYGGWRRVELPTGERGWIHSVLLSGARYALFPESEGPLYAAPQTGSRVLETVDAMVPIEIISCEADWCLLDGREGRAFAIKRDLWGVRAVETID